MELFQKAIEEMFEGHDLGFYNELRECFATKQLPKGGFLTRAGEVDNRIAFVNSGVCRTFVTDTEGKEFNKYLNTIGTFFGAYGSIISKKPSLISIQAITESELLVADFSDVDELSRKYAGIQALLRKVPEQLFVIKERREIQFVMCSAKERYELFREEFPSLENEIPQYHIASFLGITPIQLSRIRGMK